MNQKANSGSLFSNRVALVYPEKLPENPEDKVKKKDLIPFYDYFILELLTCPETEQLTIVHRPGLKELLGRKFPNKKIKLIENREVQDIWIRDFAPFHTSRNIAYKGIYNPRYFQEVNKKTLFAKENPGKYHYAYLDNEAGEEIAKNLVSKVHKVNLVIDGGNFIHNGDGTGITTNRLISENETLSIKQIKELLKEKIKIDNLIILPVEPGDETGHIDGMVRFLDRETIVVAAYPGDYREGHEFMNNVAVLVKAKFKNEPLRVTNQIPEEDPGQIASAHGNYLNFLGIGNTIFLPQYGIDLDKKAHQIYEKYVNIIPIQGDISILSELGGVLNCITWNY